MQVRLFDPPQPKQANVDAPEEYDVIYCDPPWDYDGRTFLDGKSNKTGSADSHYPTMKLSELKSLNVKGICKDKTILYMWTTGPQLDVSVDLMRAWGFKYKTIAFVWHKERTNPGYYTMSQCELCIVGTRGGIPMPRGSRNERQFHMEPRREHSSKPEEIRRRIEAMHPEGDRLEMFARMPAEGWWAWGLDAERCAYLPKLNPEMYLPW